MYLNKIDIKNCIGNVYSSIKCGEFIITKYNNYRDVEVEFIKTNYKSNYEMCQLRRGNVKDPYFPTVRGVGVVGQKYPTYIKHKNDKYTYLAEYGIWCDMLKRCYSDKSDDKNKTYKDCSVSENFKHYEYFYEWCNKQIGFNNEGWQLDKDLVVKGNKVYSEDTCVFLPQELNKLLIKNEAIRGDFPIGVFYCKKARKFISKISKNDKTRAYLGGFDTPEEAFLAYKEAKEAFIKEQALKWKGRIDLRAYEALMSYEVDIND